ncbi:hypothetical protein DH2020_019963 [Rehmannia glutinosa]|uniref:Uncharacterized protein n=1 Tax=Rehmannia glutinosa TaxID=99300 RepID=A0ABR0WG99_REHGL
MDYFNKLISDCGLIDLGCTGPTLHTWVRNNLFERLDKVLLSPDWNTLFDKTYVTHLARVWSDHAPLLVQTVMNVQKPPSRFRYMKMWVNHHYFLDNIKEVLEGPTGTFGMLNLHLKMIRVKQRLQWWNKRVFGNVFDNLKKAEMTVKNAESIYDHSPSPEHLIDLKKAIAELTLATKIEEDFWHQKSSCKWIVEGERNTKYFHNLVKIKSSKARINFIQVGTNTLSTEHEIQKSDVEFFSAHLSNDCVCLPFDGGFDIPHLPHDFDKSFLCQQPSIQEIREAVFAIDANSVVGPDGFTAHFFHNPGSALHLPGCSHFQRQEERVVFLFFA